MIMKGAALLAISFALLAVGCDKQKQAPQERLESPPQGQADKDERKGERSASPQNQDTAPEVVKPASPLIPTRQTPESRENARRAAMEKMLNSRKSSPP